MTAASGFRRLLGRVDPSRRRVAAIVLIGAVAAGGIGPRAAGQPADRSRLEKLADRATWRLDVLEREAANLAARETTLLAELGRLEAERERTRQRFTRISQELAGGERDLAEATRRLEALEQKEVGQRPAVRARLVDLYKRGRPGYLRLLLNVEDLTALGRTYRKILELARVDRLRLAEHRKTLGELRASREELVARTTRMGELQAETQRARDELDSAVAAHASLVTAIDERRDLTAQLTGELIEAHERLRSTLSTLGREGADPVLPLAPFRGALPWPLAGPVTASFGAGRASPYESGVVVRNGIEIGAPDGAVARAVHDGRVAFADAFSGFGNLVIVDHGGEAYSIYGYLSAVRVSTDATVSVGEAVGVVGRAPGGAPSLYFELRVDGAPVDPVQWMEPARQQTRER